jgi:hypothetical protein
LRIGPHFDALGAGGVGAPPVPTSWAGDSALYAAALRHQPLLPRRSGCIEAFCQTVRAGLATATFAQRRLLVELLIDRVVVTNDKVEIRYVLPTSPDGPHPPFCQLRKDHLDRPAGSGHPD